MCSKLDGPVLCSVVFVYTLHQARMYTKMLLATLVSRGDLFVIFGGGGGLHAASTD